MNKSELIALVSKLYPKDLLKQYDKFEHDDAKDLNPTVRPNASYFKIPVAYRLFDTKVTLMSDPTLHLETAKSELKEWHGNLKLIKRTEKEVSDPHTILDTKFYTPEHFDKARAYAQRNIKEIKDFAKNTLKSEDQVYLTQSDTLSNEIHRYPLKKGLVKLTVACDVFQNKHSLDRDESGEYTLDLEPLNSMPYYMHKDGIISDDEYKKSLQYVTDPLHF